MLPTPSSSQQDIEISPVPEWIAKHKVRNRKAADGESVTWLITENQYFHDERSRFHRGVYRVETIHGVEQASRLTIDFCPESNRLQLHRVQIFREGELSDRTRDGEIKVIQREAELESSLIYDGTLTAVMILHDIRVGDVIDYSYSITDLKESYPEDGVMFNFTQAPASDGLLYTSWLTSRPDQLRLAGSHSLEDAMHEVEEPLHRYTWNFDLSDPVEIEPSLPAGYLPWEYLELSTFSSFGQIARAELIPWQTDQSFDWDEVRALIDFPEDATELEKIERAIGWVMDNIRYQGIETGELARVPAPMAEVLKRRFGDCKEKSHLLIKILCALGHEAWPAIVSSRQRERVAKRLPSPYVFDHAIVCLKYEGEYHWIDATNPYVSRNLSRFRKGGYGKALILADFTEDLVEMVPYEKGDRAIETFTKVKVSPADHSGTMEHTLKATGLAAEHWKGMLERRGKKFLEQSMLDELLEFHPKTEFENGLEIIQDSYELFELRYRAKSEEMSVYSEGDRCCYFPLSPRYVANSVVVCTESEERRGPCEVPYPFSIVEKFEIHNPIFQPDRVDIPTLDSPYFIASKGISSSHGKAEGYHSYESKQAEIPASAFPVIQLKLKKLLEYVDFPVMIYVHAGGHGRRRSPGRFKKMAAGGLGELESLPEAAPSLGPKASATPASLPSSPGRPAERRKRSRSSSSSRDAPYTGPTRISLMAVFSLITGVLGLLFMFPFIFAIAFGHIALVKIKYDRALTGRGLAISGLVMGYLVLSILGLAMVYGLAVGATGGPQ